MLGSCIIWLSKCHAHNNEICQIKKNGANDLITSLTILLKRKVNEILSDVLESLSMLRKDIMYSVKSLTTKVEVAEVISPVIAYA